MTNLELEEEKTRTLDARGNSKRLRSVVRIRNFGVLFFAMLVSQQLHAAVAVLTETPSENGAGPGIVFVTDSPMPPEKQPCNASLNESVEVMVQNLDSWLTQLEEKRLIESKSTNEDLVTEQIPKLRLFIDGHPMRMLQPAGWYHEDTKWPWHGEMTDSEKQRHRYFLRFNLVRDQADAQSKEDWQKVLAMPGLMSQMDLTVGFYDPSNNGALILPSWVRRGETEATHVFIFHRVASDAWLTIGVLLMAAAVVVFILLVRFGGLVREPALPIRDDGLPPISLGRCQMAFWFFLVVTGFFFLWLVTGRGDLDTINNTVLTLIGISAGTALGAAFITSNTVDPDVAANPPSRNYPQEIRAAKVVLRNATRATPNDETVIESAKAKVRDLKKQLEDWRKRHWNQWILDLLCEDNDLSKPQIMSFHRFQIIVWTLVLGVIFCSEVLTKLGMPNFDSTLLVLMGISSGTYLGFKFPATATSK